MKLMLRSAIATLAVAVALVVPSAASAAPAVITIPTVEMTDPPAADPK